MKGRLIWFFIFLAFFSLEVVAESKKLAVYTVNYPLKYFAERIGGDAVRVSFPAPADVDPVFWNPSVEIVAEYQKADLILLNGAGYAKWLKKVSLPQAKMVNTTRAVADKYIAMKGSAVHTHGPSGAHSHGELAFTTWLDFTIAVTQARAIAAAFSRKLPKKRQLFERNVLALESDLLAFDKKLQQLMLSADAKSYFASHPVYQYFARRYDVKIHSFHWEPDVPLGRPEISELKHVLSDTKARVILWEGEPLPGSREALRSNGVDSVVFSPCGNVPGGGDLLSVMQQNLSNLRHRRDFARDNSRAGRRYDARRDAYDDIRDDYRRRRVIRTALRLGTRLARPPRASRTVVVGGTNYYYYGGYYYRRQGTTYIVVTAPAGAAVTVLPEETTVILVEGQKYYYFNGTYYVLLESGAYKVVSAPTGAMVTYVPAGYSTKIVSGTTYYVYGGAYYRPHIYQGRTVYRVVQF